MILAHQQLVRGYIKRWEEVTLVEATLVEDTMEVILAEATLVGDTMQATLVEDTMEVILAGGTLVEATLVEGIITKMCGENG